MKKSQSIMVWFLPLIVVGGLFYPMLGYLVLIAMMTLLIMAIFKPRYWCWNFCPRGSFLDLWLSKIILKKPIPKIFMKQWFRWSVFLVMFGFLGFRLLHSGWKILAIGSIFVAMCLISTIFAIIIGVATKPRAWCMACPMGLLQEKIGKIRG
jgi:ferredoxin-type protein NapH